MARLSPSHRYRFLLKMRYRAVSNPKRQVVLRLIDYSRKPKVYSSFISRKFRKPRRRGRLRKELIGQSWKGARDQKDGKGVEPVAVLEGCGSRLAQTTPAPLPTECTALASSSPTPTLNGTMESAMLRRIRFELAATDAFEFALFYLLQLQPGEFKQ